MGLPLENIRIVEMCQVYAGPFASMLLADQGAEVIKVESLEGDSSRGNATTPLGAKRLALPFLTFNRNKRSILVNIHTPKGKEVAYRLLGSSDVLIIATRVATRARWGFTYEDVAAINPRLIYASVTAFGDEGPDADLPGYDVAVQARAGDTVLRQPPDGPPPPPAAVYHFDMATGMLTAYAVLLALWHREQTGRGQKVATSILQSGIACQAVNMTRLVENSGAPPATVSRAPSTYQCGDGKYIYVTPAAPRWADYCRTIGLEELSTDARFDTQEKRQEHGQALGEVLSPHYRTRPAAEWEAMLKKESFIVTMVKAMSEAYEDPQVVANQMFTRLQQPGVGLVEEANIPFTTSATAQERWLRRPAPNLGEHTEEVLAELGYTSKEVATLIAEKAIG